MKKEQFLTRSTAMMCCMIAILSLCGLVLSSSETTYAAVIESDNFNGGAPQLTWTNTSGAALTGVYTATEGESGTGAMKPYYKNSSDNKKNIQRQTVSLSSVASVMSVKVSFYVNNPSPNVLEVKCGTGSNPSNTVHTVPAGTTGLRTFTLNKVNATGAPGCGRAATNAFGQVYLAFILQTTTNNKYAIIDNYQIEDVQSPLRFANSGGTTISTIAVPAGANDTVLVCLPSGTNAPTGGVSVTTVSGLPTEVTTSPSPIIISSGNNCSAPITVARTAGSTSTVTLTASATNYENATMTVTAPTVTRLLTIMGDSTIGLNPETKTYHVTCTSTSVLAEKANVEVTTTTPTIGLIGTVTPPTLSDPITLNNIPCDGSLSTEGTFYVMATTTAVATNIIRLDAKTASTSLVTATAAPQFPITVTAAAVAGKLHFVYANTATEFSSVTLHEQVPEQLTYQVCSEEITPAAVTLTATADASGRITGYPKTISSFNISNTISGVSVKCSDAISLTPTNNILDDSSDAFTITATNSSETASFGGTVVDDEWNETEWDWGIDGTFVWGDTTPFPAHITTNRGQTAPGEFQVTYNPTDCPGKLTTGAENWSAHFKACSLGSGGGANDVATYAVTTPPPYLVGSDLAPTTIPFNICPGNFPADKKDYGPCICIQNTKERKPNGDPGAKRCEVAPTPDANMYYSSMITTASYDWLHNFYDRNDAKNGTDADMSTDNFNRIITVDANLFPIHSAIKGDQEFPNTVMRNWPATGDASPSVNDYMNRSVAVVANYIPWTSFVPMGQFDQDHPAGIKAVGLRTHLEWVYALDPANNNFRRYKFVKVADDLMPPLIRNGLDGDIAAIPSGAQSNIGDCTNCDPCHWYYGESQAAMCSGTGNESDCCPTKSYTQTCNDKQQLWAFFAKRPAAYCKNPALTPEPDCTGKDKNDKTKCQGGGSTASMPTCSSFNLNPIYKSFPYPSSGTALGAPYMTWPLLVTGQAMRNPTNNKVKVRLELTGFSHDATSGLAVIVDSTDSDCTAVAVGGGTDKTLDKNQALTSSGKTGFVGSLSAFGNPKVGSAAQYCSSVDGCVKKAYQDFEVPAKCIKKDYTTETIGGYVSVKIYPCDGTGLVLQVPMPPKPQDQAFQVQTPSDTSTTPPTPPTAKQIRERWVNIANYLNTVPPESYPGYASYNGANPRVGYGSKSNTIFNNASSVRFKDPRDIDAFRDYFDVKNGGPTYIFVADTGNSRIQVFMNATGVAGEVTATAPIRPVRVKGPNAPSADTNEIGRRPSATVLGDGRRGDWRNYTTVSGTDFSKASYTEGAGEFYFPHGIAVDQDPDSRDVYLFVADTYNHRIQVFRDISGVSSQDIKNKSFDFKLEEMWGTYPLQTSIRVMSQPGPYNFRYPKGLDVVRFKNNSAFLYVVDSKNYRLMRYVIGEEPATLDADGKVKNGGSGAGITEIKADAGIGYHATDGFSRRLLSKMGTPMLQSNQNPGFLNPQDVSTGYSGFFTYKGAKTGTQFLNNYMVYVTDSARNNTSINPRSVSMRVMQFIDVPNQPGVFSSITGLWVPWETTRDAKFSTRTAAMWNAQLPAASRWKYNLKLGQTPFGLKSGEAFQLYSGGVYKSQANYTGDTSPSDPVTGMSNNAGVAGFFTDRPAGIDALQWNTLKPIDIRVVDNTTATADGTAKSYLPGEHIPPTTPLRIGVSSRYLSFSTPLDKRTGFKGGSTTYKANPITGKVTGGPNRIAGPWDAVFGGKVHIFCYNQSGKFTNYTALYPPSVRARFSSTPPADCNPTQCRPSYVLPSGLNGVPGKNGAANGCPSKGVVKIVAEDKDFAWSGRSGTVFYRVQ